jgi:hypothetical protein
VAVALLDFLSDRKRKRQRQRRGVIAVLAIR